MSATSHEVLLPFVIKNHQSNIEEMLTLLVFSECSKSNLQGPIFTFIGT